MPYLWTPSVQRFLVPPARTVPLAVPRQFESKVTIFADRDNATFVAIGSRNMTVATNASPNACQFQLDPGRDAEISTDDPIAEHFDLGDFYAAHDNATVTLVLYVTEWTVREV